MSGTSEPTIEAMIRAFEQAYSGSVPFREDATITAELALEARPVIEALAQAVAAGEGATAPHEAYALLTLLSHRAGRLGATPSAALCLLDAILESLATCGLTPAPGFRDQLWLVVVEGYSSGRDERVTRELRQAAARAQVCVRLAPGCLLGFVAGRLEPEVVEDTLSEIARRMLREETRSCLLDVARLEVEHTEGAARAIAGFLLTSQSLGVKVSLVVPDTELRQAIVASAGADPGALLTSDFDAGLLAALDAAAIELKSRGRRWTQALFDKPRRA